MKNPIIILCASLSLLFFCGKIIAEDKSVEELSELQESISSLQKTLQAGSKEKNLLENELMSVELEVSQ